VLVQTGDHCEFSAPGMQKCLAAAYPDFLDGLKAVRDEGRADHEQFPYSVAREVFEHVVGVGLEPWIRPIRPKMPDRAFCATIRQTFQQRFGGCECSPSRI